MQFFPEFELRRVYHNTQLFKKLNISSCWLWELKTVRNQAQSYVILLTNPLDTGLKSTCITLRVKCPYLKFFWSAFSRIPTTFSPNVKKYGLQNKNSEYGHFLRSVRRPEDVLHAFFLYTSCVLGKETPNGRKINKT